MRRFLSVLIAAALAQAPAQADTLEIKVKTDLARQAALAYAEVLGDGVTSGRLYSRDATVSGTKRHTEEFIARQFVSPRNVVSAR